MKFQVVRTSRNQEKPCENAVLEKTQYGECWFIEINTINELMDLKKECGELILTTEYDDMETIEIYDDLRE
jgi:hypothetical protein